MPGWGIDTWGMETPWGLGNGGSAIDPSLITLVSLYKGRLNSYVANSCGTHTFSMPYPAFLFTYKTNSVTEFTPYTESGVILTRADNFIELYYNSVFIKSFKITRDPIGFYTSADPVSTKFISYFKKLSEKDVSILVDKEPYFSEEKNYRNHALLALVELSELFNLSIFPELTYTKTWRIKNIKTIADGIVSYLNNSKAVEAKSNYDYAELVKLYIEEIVSR